MAVIVLVKSDSAGTGNKCAFVCVFKKTLISALSLENKIIAYSSQKYYGEFITSRKQPNRLLFYSHFVIVAPLCAFW